MQVLKRTDSGWWWCSRERDGRKGYVPASYLKIFSVDDGDAEAVEAAARAAGLSLDLKGAAGAAAGESQLAKSVRESK